MVPMLICPEQRKSSDSSSLAAEIDAQLERRENLQKIFLKPFPQDGQPMNWTKQKKCDTVWKNPPNVFSNLSNKITSFRGSHTESGLIRTNYATDNLRMNLSLFFKKK